MTAFTLTRREPYAGGRMFGSHGPFEIVEGRIAYAVDPDEPRNAGIVDLACAPRDRDGRVRFAGDFTLVHTPEDGAGRADKLLIDVPNRGRRLSFSMFNRARPSELEADPCAAGDGFLFARGFALASIGWQWGVPAGLGLDAPEALPDGEPAVGDVVCRIQPGSNRPFVTFGQLGDVAYRPESLDHPGDRLYEREHDNAPLLEVPRAAWRFARTRGDALEPSPKYIHKDGGFRAGRIYVLVYRTRGSPVTGCGLLALRDAAAALRAGRGPCGAFDRVLAFGASQTGRVLRHLLSLGLNSDRDGNAVFDGVHVHIAGGQRGDFNHRFAQPSSAGVPAAGQRFPFAASRHPDPASGLEDGLYERLEHVPRVIVTNTSWEYWRGDAALTHVSADGSRDLDQHPSERNYLLAGTQHIGGVLPPTDTFALTGERARYPFNVVDHGPLVRAALANLEAWTRGVEPPPSRVPTKADGTLVGRDAVLAKFACVDGFEGTDAAALGGLAHLDLGDGADEGICRFPAIEKTPYPRLVSDVDDTLNESAGVRLPDISVPLGAHSGWNPRHPSNGAPSQAAIFVGFSLWYGARPSRADYEARVRMAATELVEAGYVLAQDLELVVANCLGRYDIAAASEPGPLRDLLPGAP